MFPVPAPANQQFPQLLNINRQDQGGDFPLNIASGMGDFSMVKMLLQQKSAHLQLHARTIHGHTALGAAALFGHPSVVAILLGSGLDASSKNVEGLALIDEVLDDIDYSIVGENSDDDDLSTSQSVTLASGGSDPLLLEKSALLLLRNGAVITDTNAEAFQQKFNVAWGDITDEELQTFINDAVDSHRAAQMALDQARQERAQTPAMVVREVDQQAAPSLFRRPQKSDAAPESTPGGRNRDGSVSPRVLGPVRRVSPRSPRRTLPPKGSSHRSRAGRMRQRRYVRSPKVIQPGTTMSPSKPPSPVRSAARGHFASPGSQHVVTDLSSLGDVRPTGECGEGSEGAPVYHSDDSLEVSWSKQLAQENSAPLKRPSSHESVLQATADLELERSGIKLPLIERK